MTASAPSLNALFRKAAQPMKSFRSTSNSKSSTLHGSNDYGLHSLSGGNTYKAKINGGGLSKMSAQNKNDNEQDSKQDIAAPSSEEYVDRVTKTVKIEVDYMDENSRMPTPR
jgi:hypothetical protein